MKNGGEGRGKGKRGEGREEHRGGEGGEDRGREGERKTGEYKRKWGMGRREGSEVRREGSEVRREGLQLLLHAPDFPLLPSVMVNFAREQVQVNFRVSPDAGTTPDCRRKGGVMEFLV